MAKRVAHLERKRYRDEREALKKEIKHLKMKDKQRRRKRAASLEDKLQTGPHNMQDRVGTVDGKSSHLISMN